jgi:hypothetical protein
MKRQDDIEEWIRRAKSNLIRAKTLKINDDVYYEDLCFDAQAMR